MNLFKSSFNKFDLIIIITIISVVFAGPMFGSFTPIRIIGFCSWIYYFLFVKVDYRIRKLTLFFHFIIFYSTISVLWNQDIHRYIIDFLVLITNIGVFLLIYYAHCKARSPIESIILGWVIFTLINLIVSFWEINSGIHLYAGNYQTDNMTYDIDGVLQSRVYAAVTYGNFNSLSVVLCLCFYMLLLGISIYDEIKNKMFFLILILGIIYVEFINTSRGCLLSLFFSIVPIYKILKSSNNIKLLVCIISPFIAYMYIEYSDFFTFLVESKLSERSANFSDDPRFRIILDGISIALNQFCIGGGPGCQVSEFTNYGNYITYSHNLWLQTLIEYGLVILIILFYSITKFALKSFFSNNKIIHIIGCLLIFSWPILTIVDESYMKSIHWLFFSSILSIVHYITSQPKQISKL